MLFGGALGGLRRAAAAAMPGRRPSPRGGSPRVLVLGVCQGAAIGRGMSYLMPGAEVTVISAFRLRRRFRRLADLVAESRRHDVVFSNTYLPVFPDGHMAAFRAAVDVRLMPTIVFSAFHPDQVRVGSHADPEGKDLVVGPMGHSHSALTLFGHLEGLSVEETLRLFRGDVYAGLGYLDGWEGSVEALRGLGREVGYDLDRDLARWMRRGCFMHCDNHPKMHVLSDLARGLLRAAGLPFVDCDLDSYLPDDQQEIGCWPVYPEIAESFGVPGSALFLKAPTRKTGPARTMLFAEFVEASFARYRRTPAPLLACERVAAWRADEGARSFLRQAAGTRR